MKQINKVSDLLKEDNVYYNNFMDSLYCSLSFLSKDYPDFKSWYFRKMKVELENGYRDILFSTYKNQITGVAILKDFANEKKICTIRVYPQFKNMGFGKSLIEKSIEILQYETPMISVSESRIYQFENILSYFKFELVQITSSYYKKGQVEYVYNGELESNIKKLAL